MRIKRLLVVVCVITMVFTAYHIQSSVVVRGDVNKDTRVDILDIQRTIADTVDSGRCTSPENTGILAFQQTLAEASAPRPHRDVPPAHSGSQGCYFSFQGGWQIMAPAYLSESLSWTFAEPQSPAFDRPSRSLSPAARERYLFRLTSNAPPVCA